MGALLKSHQTGNKCQRESVALMIVGEIKENYRTRIEFNRNQYEDHVMMLN